jgi:hypothetical protein
MRHQKQVEKTTDLTPRLIHCLGRYIKVVGYNAKITQKDPVEVLIYCSGEDGWLLQSCDSAKCCSIGGPILTLFPDELRKQVYNRRPCIFNPQLVIVSSKHH